MITVLSGGTGTPKLIQGLIKVVQEETLTIIVNTGDDINLFGLHISPDIDTILYMLSGILDEEKWWGIKNDTFNCLELLAKYGHDTWFLLGDRDFATHIYRTLLLKKYSLSETISIMSTKLGIKAKILPVTNDTVMTKIRSSKNKILAFQEFWVREKGMPEVHDVFFDGVEIATPAPGVVDSLIECEGIIIGPSNPITSIEPILGIKGIKQVILDRKKPVIAVSPIIGEAPVSGPAGKLMKGLGIEVSSFGVAQIYSELIDVLIIDKKDRELKNEIESLGLEVHVTNILMKKMEDKIQLSKEIIGLIKAF